MEGKYFINDQDIYLAYGVVFEKDAFNELLKFPEGKGGYSEEWPDESNDFLAPLDATVESLTITVPFLLMADDRNDFLSKYNRFKAFLVKQQYFHLDVADLAMRFKLRYKNMPSFNRITPVTKMRKVACKLSLTLVDDFPLERTLFEDVMRQARKDGWTVDAEGVQAAMLEVPYHQQKSEGRILPIYKPGQVAYVKNGIIEPLSFSRASAATFIDKDGKMKTAAPNVPRFNYDANGRYLGLMNEEAGMNLILISHDLTSWYYDENPMPRGLFLNGSAAWHLGGYAQSGLGVQSGEVLTFSVFAKKESSPTCSLYIEGDTLVYDFETEKILSSNNRFAACPYPDGWVRLSITTRPTEEGMAIYRLQQGLYSSPQLDMGGEVTSYIPSLGSTGVRAAEAISSPTI